MRRDHVEVLPASDTYVARFASQLRQADRDELRALDPTLCPEESLRESVRLADEAWMAVSDEGEIVAMWGCRLFEGTLIPWLLGSERIVNYPMSLVRLGREYVARLDARGLPMWNVVWSENVVSQQWLEVLGFTVERDFPIEVPSGAKFYRFSRGLGC